MKKVVNDSPAVDEPKELPQRLCSEIQLFDLCELESCRYKDGRFCTDTALLARFEAISDVEERPANPGSMVEYDDEDDEESYREEREEDDDDYSVFDDDDDAVDDW